MSRLRTVRHGLRRSGAFLVRMQLFKKGAEEHTLFHSGEQQLKIEVRGMPTLGDDGW